MANEAKKMCVGNILLIKCVLLVKEAKENFVVSAKEDLVIGALWRKEPVVVTYFHDKL